MAYAIAQPTTATVNGILTFTASLPTGGVGPFTYQWYRSTSGTALGTALTGQTALTLTDATATEGKEYYYTLVAIDTGAGNTTTQTSQVRVIAPAKFVYQNHLFLGSASSTGVGTVNGLPFAPYSSEVEIMINTTVATTASMDVYLDLSIDGGQTWSQEAKINTAAVTAVGTTIFPIGTFSTNTMLGDYNRIRFVITAGTISFTATLLGQVII